MGIIGNFNSNCSTIEVLEALNAMSNEREMSDVLILARFAESTGNGDTEFPSLWGFDVEICSFIPLKD